MRQAGDPILGPHVRTAAQRQRLTGHERAGLRSEEDHYALQVFRFSQASERDLLFRALLGFGVVPEGASEVGLDEARADRVDSNTVRPQLGGQGGQGLDLDGGVAYHLEQLFVRPDVGLERRDVEVADQNPLGPGEAGEPVRHLGQEVELVGVDDRTARLGQALSERNGYDICFIDCPPSLGLLTLNALGAADTLLVPLQCEFFALEGLSQLLQTVERVQERFNPDLGIIGVVLTMFDRRNRLTDQVADDVRDCLGNLVFEAVIPRNVRLSEAPSHGLPALIYDHACPGSRAYIALARELIGRLPQERKAA